jgi:F-type H+-transporting ATPase subunit delta
MQVAGFVAEKLVKHRKSVVQSAAAWLVATGRTRQADYLARDVAAAFAGDGYVLAQVTTARPLSAEAQQDIEKFIKNGTGATSLELVTVVEPELVGGVRIETPGMQLDATVRRKLAKFAEGITQ